eukprot:1707180-Pleurochrysis_carterae.AAC.1
MQQVDDPVEQLGLQHRGEGVARADVLVEQLVATSVCSPRPLALFGVHALLQRADALTHGVKLGRPGASRAIS